MFKFVTCIWLKQIFSASDMFLLRCSPASKKVVLLFFNAATLKWFDVIAENWKINLIFSLTWRGENFEAKHLRNRKRGVVKFYTWSGFVLKSYEICRASPFAEKSSRVSLKAGKLLRLSNFPNLFINNLKPDRWGF